jgi:hypothetical protein
MMSHGIDLQDSFRSLNAKLSFMVEIDKHMVTSFSSLVLHIATKGRMFGAIGLYLLGLIRSSIRNLKVVLLGSEVIYHCAYTFETYAVPFSKESLLEQY